MIRIILTILLTLLGFNNNTPKRLQPQNNTVIPREYLLLLLIILAFIGFIIFCFLIVGTSATESGALYNNELA